MSTLLTMAISAWYLVIGALLLVMATTGSILKRLPISSSLLYLGVGLVLGWAGVVSISPSADARLLERASEICVIASLFTTGLRFRPAAPPNDWSVPVRLAAVAMVATVALVAAIGVLGLGLPLGGAVLLGAVLAPTDPVLASDVQVERPGEEHPVRHALTGEAGLNDGTAFPFVMLGLGLLGAHELGTAGWRWVAVDLAWAVAAGLAVGFVLARGVGRLVLYLRQEHREAVGADEFLTLGLIAVAYGAALAIDAYGFLAVFAAGVALRRFESRASRSAAPAEARAPAEDAATHPAHAPGYLADTTLALNTQLEHVLELGIMLLVGVLLASTPLPWGQLWFVPVLLLLVRPLAVWVGLLRTGRPRLEQALIGWFGIRGVGSVYYLFFAATHGAGDSLVRELNAIVLTVIAASVLLHGVSVTPLMRWYDERRLTPSRTPSPGA